MLIFIYLIKINCMTGTPVEILDGILREHGSTGSAKLDELAASAILSRMLFEVTRAGSKVVEVRDYDSISQVGAFRYSGQVDTMLREGLMPQDVHDRLLAIRMDRHVGPSYLRVKGLLTHQGVRRFFGRQAAYAILHSLEGNPLAKPDGYIVCVPNMTGGAWIGDETSKQLQEVQSRFRIWPVTPYARETRKGIEAVDKGAKYGDHVEGLMPSPDETAAVVCFEELRTAAETTKNATDVHRTLGEYNDERGVRIVEACVFDYGHPVGVERLRRLGADRVYVVGGITFFDASRGAGYISASQHQTATDWLTDPWTFTRRILPDLERLATTR
ncbi:hypothetical protein HY501_03330 [Candidatus Woesearchaeota archaeon]|nr:hypothetical protein [Candidatus Woesearchaeota archaeon]